jgi:hypothetical protein
MKMAACSNRTGCTLAYKGSEIRFDKSPICPECGQPLTIGSDAERGKGVQALIWIALIQLFPILTFVENLLVRARALPYPTSPEAISLRTAYIVIEAIFFLLLVAYLLIRYVKWPKDWIAWYTALSLIIFALYQLAVFAAFEAKTLFESDAGFVVLMRLIGWAAFPLLILSMISLLRVCFTKISWRAVIASASLVVSSLFFTVLSGVVGVVQMPSGLFWHPDAALNEVTGVGGQNWIAIWSTLIFILAWVMPVRFALREMRGARNQWAKPEGTNRIAGLSTPTVTIIITIIQVTCVLAFVQLSWVV